MNAHDDHGTKMPEDLIDTAALADRLGAVERASFSPEAAARIASATRPTGRGRRTLAPVGWLAMAASLMLVIGAATLIVGQRGVTAGGPAITVASLTIEEIEEDIDLLFGDEELLGWEIADASSIAETAADLAGDVADPWASVQSLESSLELSTEGETS